MERKIPEVIPGAVVNPGEVVTPGEVVKRCPVVTRIEVVTLFPRVVEPCAAPVVTNTLHYMK